MIRLYGGELDRACCRHSNRDDLGPEAVLKLWLLCRSHHAVVLSADLLHLLIFSICLLVYVTPLGLGDLLRLGLLHDVCHWHKDS